MKQTFNPCDECEYSYSKQNQDSGMCKICEFKKILELEKQRKLLNLPCMVGQSVWKIKNGKISKCGVSTIKIEESRISFCNAVYVCDISDFGKTVFLTMEEAESVLKERDNYYV